MIASHRGFVMGSQRPTTSTVHHWVGACASGAMVAYDAVMAFTRISIDHRIMGGVPCIRGTRIPVAMLVRMVANGTPIATLLDEYPQLSEDDIREALRFAAARVDERTIPLDLTA